MSYFASVQKPMVILFVLVSVGCATNQSSNEAPTTASPSQEESETVLRTSTSRSLDSSSTATSSTLNEDSSSEGWGIEETLISLPTLGDPLVGHLRLTGRPFEPVGAIPTGIIASTDGCDIVAIDSATSEAETLWRYPGRSELGRWGDDCGETGFDHRGVSGAAEIMPERAELPPGFIDDIEWIQPHYVLVSFCCEPAVGRFEIIDTITGEMDWLALSGSYPSIDGQTRLLYVDPTRGPNDGVGYPLGAIMSVSLDVSGFISEDSGEIYYSLGEQRQTRLFLQADSEVGGSDFVSSVSWLDAPNLVAQLWSYREGESTSWVAYIDSESKITINSRGSGWMFPTGDDSGNLLVAEQRCPELWQPCDTADARVVVVDVPDLTPLHEVEIDGAVADMDLVSGHLLVTLTDGRMGTLDLADGTFNVIARGVRRAVWQE